MRKFFIIIIVSDTEVIIQDVHNHNSIEEIMQFMSEKFGSNNYFIGEDLGYTELTRFEYIKVYKNKASLIGPNYENYNTDIDLTYSIEDRFTVSTYYILNNYPQIMNIENWDNYFDESEFNQNIKAIEYAYEKNSKKKLTIDKWKYKIPARVINHLFDIDDSKKYVDWLCKLYFNYGILQEDFDKLKMLLNDFDNPQVKAYLKRKSYPLDINNYKNDKVLFEAIKDSYYDLIEEIEASNRDILLLKRRIFEYDNWIVVTPKTHEEAVTLGRGTYWCTSGDSTEGNTSFNHYTSNGKYDLIIFINKLTYEKFQYSEFTHDFLDGNDKNFNVEHVFKVDFIEKYFQTVKNSFVPTIFLEQLYTYLGNEYDYLKYAFKSYYELRDDILQTPNKIDISICRNNDIKVRESVVKQGLFLNEFINDISSDVRTEVARQGYGLDILIDDNNPYVRREVAKQGYGLDILKNDNDSGVRLIIAEYGLYWDEFLYDKDYDIRTFLAENKYRLDVLINDKNSEVRRKVARQGYGLDILVNDPDPMVRVIITKVSDDYDEILKHDENGHVHIALISKGKFIDYYLETTTDKFVIIKLTQLGYGLDKWINHEDSEVRFTIVTKGYGLDILVNDPDPLVRRGVANSCWIDCFDILVNDFNGNVSTRAQRNFNMAEEKDFKTYVNPYGFECYIID